MSKLDAFVRFSVLSLEQYRYWIQLRTSMACHHKFADHLTLEHIDFEFNTLIVGTFNPSWEELDNYAPWFYGRVNNNYFWDILPIIYGCSGLRRLGKSDWQSFCRQQRIALTDLIACIEDADRHNPEHVAYLKSYSDDAITRHFREFSEVDIVGLLKRYPGIRQIYLTRQASYGFWKRQWTPIEEYCRSQGISANTLLTPSGGARFQFPKDEQLSLVDFIAQEWRRKWHF